MAVPGTDAGSADVSVNTELRSPSAIVPGRFGRRFRKGYTTQASWPLESGELVFWFQSFSVCV